MLKSIIFTVSVFWASSLADLRLSCHPFTPTCPGTVVHCQCDGAVGSLTWNVRSEGSSCTLYIGGIQSASYSGDCSAVTTKVSFADTNPNVTAQMNSGLVVNLMENTTVTCADITLLHWIHLFQVAREQLAT